MNWCFISLFYTKMKLGWTDLRLIKDEYENNGRIYLWLVDVETGEYFSDITVNVPDMELSPNECLIDPSFELAFGKTDEMRKWLEDNLNIKSWGVNQWYYCFTL